MHKGTGMPPEDEEDGSGRGKGTRDKECPVDPRGFWAGRDVVSGPIIDCAMMG